MEFTATEREHMARALVLAERGMHTATPNPRVGCVIVKDGIVAGEGWHVRSGEPHAEINALADAHAKGTAVRGATMFVTLEPCNRQGRTPPCVDAIISAGIARVVVAMHDPNPDQARGADRLRAAGVVVDVGLLSAESHELNIGFVTRMTRGRPWVRVKLAATLDGRTALDSGESQWITGPAARADGHAWRARACAILTGVGTVLQDDPALTVRSLDTTRQPLRIIVDRHGRTPPTAKVLADNNALLVTAGARHAAWPSELEVLELPDAAGRVDLGELMRVLATRGINELHVEAGAKLSGALLDAGLVDELLLYLAPSLIGDPARGMFERATPLTGLAARTALAWHSIDRCGDDVRVIARLVNGSTQ